MKLIVGLGNPGKEYEKTRHNAGFEFVDFIALKKSLLFNAKFKSLVSEFSDSNSEKVFLLKPQTFMNSSGSAVQEIVKFFKISPENIFIAFDDLDLSEGSFKLQNGKYPKVHNGINDIINKLGTDKLNFIRIGIDGRSEELRKLIVGRDYVLQKTNLSFQKVFQEICLQMDL